MFHFAAGGSRTAGGSAYFSTEATEEEVKNGIGAAGGMMQRVQVVPLPIKGQYHLPEHKQGLRYVVDSGTTMIQRLGWEDSMKHLTQLKAQVKAHQDNLFISLVTPLHSLIEQATLRQWADGVIEMGFDRQGFGLYSYLKVTKMRGVPDSARLLLFRETEQGLAVESTRRVF